MIRLVLALTLSLAWVGCSKKQSEPAHDTPEGTVRGFFQALESGKIPNDLDRYFIDTIELDTWRMRCQTRGCAGGQIRKLEVVEQHEYRAVIALDYIVRSEGGGRLMKGKGSPITLVREGRSWYITQWGERLSVRSGDKARLAPARDAGTAAEPQ